MATGPEIVGPDNLKAHQTGADRTAPSRHRAIVFDGISAEERCPVYRRTELASAATINGPCVIEEDELTIVIGPGSSAAIDDYSNLVIEVPQTGAADV